MGKRIFRTFWHVKESPLNMLYSWFSSNAFASLDMCVCVCQMDIAWCQMDFAWAVSIQAALFIRASLDTSRH